MTRLRNALRSIWSTVKPALASWLTVGFVVGSLDFDDWSWWGRAIALLLIVVFAAIFDHKEKP